MKPLTAAELSPAATRAADKYTGYFGGASAERMLKLAYEIVRAKNVLLKQKYDEGKE